MPIGALGVIADTAVTQASAVMALRRTNTTMSTLRLYREAFTVGRDHLGHHPHARPGLHRAALPLLLAMHQSRFPLIDALNAQTVAASPPSSAAGR